MTGPVMNVHTWVEDRYELRPSGDKIMAMCSHITGKSRMTNDEDFRDGKSFRGGIWQLRTGMEISERIWMVGDIVIVFDHFSND